MPYKVAIDWLYGCPRDPSAEEVRATTAARRVFEQAGIDGCTAEKDYYAQGGFFGNEAAMTGHARVWLDARDAANLAATESWPDPTRARISIECRPNG